MNILDENTKAMLDNGSTVILDGKYLVMTPETLKQAVQDDLIITIGDKEEANSSFIQRGRSDGVHTKNHWRLFQRT